jgi:hypothetical protein
LSLSDGGCHTEPFSVSSVRELDTTRYRKEIRALQHRTQ